jgi:hypothetical protein
MDLTEATVEGRGFFISFDCSDIKDFTDFWETAAEWDDVIIGEG